MKDLEKQKTDLRTMFWVVVFGGIAVVITVFSTLFKGYSQSPMTLMVTALTIMLTSWLIVYIDYRLLKLKIEMTEELSKGNETSVSN